LSGRKVRKDKVFTRSPDRRDADTKLLLGGGGKSTLLHSAWSLNKRGVGGGEEETDKDFNHVLDKGGRPSSRSKNR